MKGAYGWGIIAATIVAIDLTAPDDETLTSACHRALKRNPALVLVIVASTTLHLLLGWDARYRRIDAFRALEGARGYARALKVAQTSTADAGKAISV